MTASLPALQNSSQYSSWFQQCCGLDGLDFFLNFQFPQYLILFLGFHLSLVSLSILCYIFLALCQSPSISSSFSLFSSSEMMKSSTLFVNRFFICSLLKIRESISISKSHIIIIFTLCQFFTSVLTGAFSLKSKWQQVSSDLKNSSQYSSWF